MGWNISILADSESSLVCIVHTVDQNVIHMLTVQRLTVVPFAMCKCAAHIVASGTMKLKHAQKHGAEVLYGLGTLKPLRTIS